MELLVAIIKVSWPQREVKVSLVTIRDEFKPEKQDENFGRMRDSCIRYGLKFDWSYDDTRTIHARSIVTNTGWKIDMDRGLDIYQQFDVDAFSVAAYLPEVRRCKKFEITFLKKGEISSN